MFLHDKPALLLTGLCWDLLCLAVVHSQGCVLLQFSLLVLGLCGGLSQGCVFSVLGCNVLLAELAHPVHVLAASSPLDLLDHSGLHLWETLLLCSA